VREYPRDWQRWTEEEDARLVRLHGRRLSYKQLARLLGRTPHAVEHRLCKLGARVLSSRQERERQVAALHSRGMTDGQIARELRVTENYAQMIRHRWLGLKPNRRSA
jgi:DNA-binding CsgD family transcriptional regulator